MAVDEHPGRTGTSVELPIVAIVGRPNVGKSTLFNRIVGRRVAIVAERPGVTRDRQFAPAEWAGCPFQLVDTGGIVDAPDQDMDREIRTQVDVALHHAHVIVFVVDGREGLTAVDRYVADILRKSGRPTVLAVNKLDALAGAEGHYEFYELGLGDPVPLSALSGKGSGDLLDRVADVLPRASESPAESLAARVAVIGRPNVGKSSFVNRLLGESRLIVHDEAGTTRDSIDTYLEWGGQRLSLIDTAGLRRQARVDDDVEYYGRVRTEAAIQRADVCLLLIDTQAGAANQDFRIGQHAWDQGRGLVLVANKWDLVEERGPDNFDRFVSDLRERAPLLRWVPIVTTSALTGQRVGKALDLALEVQAARHERVPTARVNQVLEGLLARHQPPQGGRGDVRFLYGSQVGVAPPLFVLWVNRPKDVKEHYIRYLKAGFRDAWGFEGTDVRIKLKKRGGR